MIVIVSGSRHTPDALTDQHLEASKLWAAATFVLAGGCEGPDKRAVELAKRRGLPFEEIPALWNNVPPKERAQQGPIRNSKLLARATELARERNTFLALVALWDGASHGTADMLRKARAHKNPPVAVEEISVPIQAQAVKRSPQGSLFHHTTDEGRRTPRQAPYRAATEGPAPTLSPQRAALMYEAGAPYLPREVAGSREVAVDR